MKIIQHIALYTMYAQSNYKIKYALANVGRYIPASSEMFRLFLAL